MYLEEATLTDTIKLLVELPKSLAEELWPDTTQASAGMKEAVVLELFRQGRISIRKAGVQCRGCTPLAG